jgi:hypothetical protein
MPQRLRPHCDGRLGFESGPGCYIFEAQTVADQKHRACKPLRGVMSYCASN